MSDSLEGITWFRGSSVRIRRKGLETHMDPHGVDKDSEVDFALLTYLQNDNFSEDDIARVRGEKTALIASTSMKKQLDSAYHFVRPGDTLQLDGFDILAVPAHNVDKKHHAPEQGWLGYVFTIPGTPSITPVTPPSSRRCSGSDVMSGFSPSVVTTPRVLRMRPGPVSPAESR